MKNKMGKGNKFSILRYCKSRRGGRHFAVLVLLIFLIAAVSTAFLLHKNNVRVEPSIRFISILHRHGERAPILTYPLDPYKDADYWSDGPGELLPKGKVTEFKLGQFLRNRYDGFISGRYKASEIRTVSSFVDRCLMSAQLVLAGLYPPIGTQIWNPELLWQPIPVHTNSAPNDDIIFVTKHCALLEKEKAYFNANVIQKKLDENQDLLNFLSKETGRTIKTIDDLDLLHDNLLIAVQFGFKLPGWAQDIFDGKLRSFAAIASLSILDTPVMRKFYSGVLINDILSSMRLKSNATNNFERRLNLYSAHDWTIARLWQAIGVTEELGLDKPLYGSALIFELHETKENRHRVKILYKRGTQDTKMGVLTIKGCENDQETYHDGMCDLDIFSSALQSVTITDFNKACQVETML